jgi:hypothetical protein
LVHVRNFIQTTHPSRDGKSHKRGDKWQVEDVGKAFDKWSDRYIDRGDAHECKCKLWKEVSEYVPLIVDGTWSTHISDKGCLWDELNAKTDRPSDPINLYPNRDRDVNPVSKAKEELEQQALECVIMEGGRNQAVD